MSNLFDPPPTAQLPVSLGRDIVLTFRNKVPDSDPVEYLDFPDDVSVALAIGKSSSEVRGVAAISGHEATCRIESELADGLKTGALWRVIVSVTADGHTEDDVPLNGTVVRSDGA